MDFIDFYYNIKPFLPRSLQLGLRRMVLKNRLKRVNDTWPISESAGTLPLKWQGWPDGKQFAVVITHDVESSKGLSRCQKLAELDRSFGFRSAFNIVPCKYDVPDSIRNWLTANGFEVGVHDYNHDGKLYRSKAVFDRRATIINEYIKKWNASGFRSAAMHHNLEWLSTLDISYDCSTFDTDPFEPQSDGVNTIFPFWYNNKETGKCFVEIPYTLPQDHTLFVVKGERDCRIWKEKLKWIAEKGGMATVIVHPDYVNFDKDAENGVDEYSCALYEDLLYHIGNVYSGEYWNPLPKELASCLKQIGEGTNFLPSNHGKSQILK